MPFFLKQKPNLRRKRAKIKKAKEKFLSGLGDKVIKNHKSYVADWDSPVDFFLENDGNSLEVKVVDPTGNWARVNYGTAKRAGRSEYEVKPKKPGGVLAITLGYQPHTTTRSHGGPGKAKGPTIFTKKAVIKGIKPRKLIQRAIKDSLPGSVKIFLKIVGDAIFS